MTRYIALLRGINVGGNTKVPMPELKAVFESLGFANIATYINSGNIAFDTGDPPVRKPARGKGVLASGPHVIKGSAGLESKPTTQIEAAIEHHFNLNIQVMLREQSVIETILRGNPFANEFESHKEMHVLFMRNEMPEEKRAQLLERQTDDERFAIRGREIYCHLRLGVADSLLGKGFIERKLKVPITARNWRTVQKLAEL